MEINRSAFWVLARAVRSSSGRNLSDFLVRMASNFSFSLSFFCSFLAIARATSFSRTPVGPTAPGSLPPWPGSITTFFTPNPSCWAKVMLGTSPFPGDGNRFLLSPVTSITMRKGSLKEKILWSSMVSISNTTRTTVGLYWAARTLRNRPSPMGIAPAKDGSSAEFRRSI